MRDLLVLFFLVGVLPLGLKNAFASYLLWGWAGLLAVNAYVYGFMQSVPFVQLFAFMTLLMLLLRPAQIKVPFNVNPTAAWMLIFVAHGLLVAIFAFPGLPRNWELFGNVAKTVLFCVIMPMLVTSRQRIHTMVIMIVLAMAFHGLLDGLKFIASAGKHNAQGIAKFGDNNHFAMVQLMIIPLLFYVWQYSYRWYVRAGFAVVLVLTTFAVIATHSRGGLLGLIAVVSYLLLRSRRRVLSTVIALVAAFAVVQLAPSNWFDRMQTIKSANEDASFLGRVGAWKVSSAIAIDHPLVGGGYRAVQSPPIWDRYSNAPSLLDFLDMPALNTNHRAAAHSIWFEVLGDAGFVGLLLFAALFVNAFFTHRDILRLVKRGGLTLRWASDLSYVLVAALLAFLISGSLLSAAYFELHFMFMMLLECLRQHLRREVAATSTNSASLN